MFAGLTHELKSPLAAIESALEILADQAVAAPDKQAHYLEMIQRNADRLRHTVESLLETIRTDAAKASASHAAVELIDVIEDVIASYQPLALISNVSLINDNRERVVWVIGERAKIEQVISNLISNAIKYSRNGTVRWRVNCDKENARVQIEDTGHGIPPEDLPHVFEKFYRGRAIAESKGTGIGLNIAKHWVETLGGCIHAESDGLGHGSRFWFRLPRTS